MERMKTILFYLGLASLLTHELDAVTHSEWQLLPFLRALADEVASPLFVSMHVPLIFFVLWVSHHRKDSVRKMSRMVISGFLVLHAGLHSALLVTPDYAFDGVLSNVLILSAGAFGVAYLVSDWRTRDSEPV